MRKLISAIVVLALFLPSLAFAGPVGYAGKKAAQVAAGIAIKRGMQRLTVETVKIARLCIQKNIGTAIRNDVTDAVINELVDAYLGELRDYGGHNKGSDYSDSFKEQARQGEIRPLGKSDVAKARSKFDTARQSLKDKFAQVSGIPWPKEPSIKGDDGIVRPGADYQYHHDRPLKYGGSPTDLRNGSPIPRKYHQGGVHGRDGTLKILLSCMKARGQ